MKNLLHENWSIAELEELLSRHPSIPLLPGYGSEDWARVARNPIACELAAPLREIALKECSTPLPELTDELYADFRRTGHRIRFEKVYFERRRRLARAAITLILGGPDAPSVGQLTASMLEKFTAVFEEVSWTLPAHVDWHNDDDSGKEPFQIDLFCAETSNLMAEMLDMFAALIPSALQVRVRGRLQSHVFENYLNNFDHFHWTKVAHNWNAVCHQGVIGAALSQVNDAGQLSRMLLLAGKSLPLFVSGFAHDGGCSEGIGYWSYGFGWFSVLNEQLEIRTGGEISLFEGDEHIRKIARFGPSMSLAGGKLVNFSDNAAEGRLSAPLLSYLGRRLNEPDCSYESAKSYRHLIQAGIEKNAERCDVFFLGRLFLRCPEKTPEPEDHAAADCFLPDLAVLVAHGQDQRGHLWDFAAKAGHNDEHHNHNDCGNFLLNIDGVRFVAEIGAPEYDKDFFSPKRYESLAARSIGHSLPVINGVEQAAGATFASSVAAHILNPERAEFVVDATACYPPEAGCRHFMRTISFEKLPGKLTMLDYFYLSRIGSLEGALIASCPVVREENCAFIRSENLEMIVRALPGTKLDRVEIHLYNDHFGREASVHRLVWKPETLTARCSLAVEMKLA